MIPPTSRNSAIRNAATVQPRQAWPQQASVLRAPTGNAGISALRAVEGQSSALMVAAIRTPLALRIDDEALVQDNKGVPTFTWRECSLVFAQIGRM